MPRLVLQHIQILVEIHDPRDWPVPIWKRTQRQKVATSEENDRERARQSFPGTHVEEGESTHNLVSSHPLEA